MLLGCIADDFTGASDLANTLAKGGMTTIQFAGVPATAAVPACEAGVVALKTRSVAAEEAVRSEEHTSELQSLMRISYAVFCLKKKTDNINSKQHKIHRDTYTTTE